VGLNLQYSISMHLVYVHFNYRLFTKERLDEMEQVSSSLTKVLGSNSAFDMQQR